MKKSFLENSSIHEKRQKIEGGLLMQKKLTSLRNSLNGLPVEMCLGYSGLLERIYRFTEHAKTFGKKPVDGGIVEVNYQNRNLPGFVISKKSSKLECLLVDFDRVLDDFEKSSPQFSTKFLVVHTDEIIAVYREGLHKNKVHLLKANPIDKKVLPDLISSLVSIRQKQESIKTCQYLSDRLGNLDERDSLVSELLQHPLFHDPTRHSMLSKIGEMRALERDLAHIEESKSSDLNTMEDEINKRLLVLRKYDYMNRNDVVQLKGLVLSQKNRDQGMIIVESLFRGIWRDLSPIELAGVLSPFVCQDRATVDLDWRHLSPVMHQALLDTHQIMGEILEE